MAGTTHGSLTVIGTRETSIGGQTISYMLKRSAKAKYVRLEVRAETGLAVTIPGSFKIGHIPDLLEAKKSWILSKLAKYGQFCPVTTERELKGGDTIPFLGRDLEVVIRQEYGNADSVKLERNKLAVNLTNRNGRLNSVLEQWYRMQAATIIKDKVDKLSAQWGLTYNRLTIRGQKTRWGSCSHKGNLNFNWKLIMAPEPVIDYVIIHELAHLKEMNHTKSFWELVAERCPRWRELKKWLKDHGPELARKVSA